MDFVGQSFRARDSRTPRFPGGRREANVQARLSSLGAWDRDMRPGGRPDPAAADRRGTRPGRHARATFDSRHIGDATDYNAGKAMETVSLVHHFLIAMPAMVDPNFSRTLTYICEHNDEGALGVIVNRPTEMNLALLFERVSITLENEAAGAAIGSQPVYFGGPVQTDRGFVLHRPVGHWQSTLSVRDQIGLTSSRDILQAMGASGEPAETLVALGYAGWSGGQLEWELSQNAWLTVAAAPRIIFELPPEERLAAAMKLLGVDFAT